MAVLTWPAEWYRMTDGRFYLSSRSLFSVSRFSGRRNVHGPIVQQWTATITLAPQERELWQPIAAFISKLDGQAGLLRMADPWRRRLRHWPAATGFGEPWSDGTTFSDSTGWIEDGPVYSHVADAAARGADSIVLGGLAPSQVPMFVGGDLLELQPSSQPTPTGNLYEIVGGASTDASGMTRVSIRPRLRQAFAVGDRAVLRDATSVFRLVDDEQGIVERDFEHQGHFGMSLVEHV